MLLGMRSLWEVRFHRFTQVLTAALTFNGALRPSRYQALEGALTFTGTLLKQARIRLSGGLTFTGDLVSQFFALGRRIVFGAVHRMQLVLHEWRK